MSNATIKDVAGRAGVSIATVSYVLNNTRPVKAETRTRVEKAISELHYMPNPAAQHLRGRQSRIIGFITPTCNTAFYSSVFSACDRELFAHDYHILIANSTGDPETERELICTLGNGIVDGLIIFTACQNTEELRRTLPSNIPCVVLDIHFPSHVDSVTHSFSNAFQEVASYYKQRGHEQVAVFVGKDSLNSVQEQHRAYRLALEAHGLPYREELCIPSGRFHNRRDAVEHLVSKGCTALCFVDFNIMFDTFYDTNKRGFYIPPELDIVCGCESPMDYLLLKTIPRIMVPTEEIGQLAARQILFRLQESAETGKDPILPQRTVIPCVVQYPESC